RGLYVEQTGTRGASPVDSWSGAPSSGNEVAESAVGVGGGGPPGSIPDSNFVDREHPVERLAGDLLHPFATESLGHRPGRRLAPGVHTDRCRAERPALSVYRDDGLSLAAEGDRSYLIAPVGGLRRHGGDERLGGLEHGLGVDD